MDSATIVFIGGVVILIIIFLAMMIDCWDEYP